MFNETNYRNSKLIDQVLEENGMKMGSDDAHSNALRARLVDAIEHFHAYQQLIQQVNTQT